MLRRLLLFSILVVLSACFGGKNNIEPAPLVEFTPTLALKQLWTANAGGGVEDSYFKISPAFHKGQLFTASPEGHVRAYDFSDGRILWKRKIDVPISGGPGVGEGLVLLGSQKGEVVALSKQDGIEQWRTPVSSEVLVAPRISQGVVVVRTGDGKIFGFESKTGKRLWVYGRARVPLLSLRGTSTPLITRNVIIAGFDDGKLALLELLTGKALWEYTVAIPRGRTQLERMVDIDADPLLQSGIIYVTSYQGRTVAIDLFKGKLLWEKKLSSHAGLGADNNYLYVSDAKSHVWALEHSSGKDWWKQEKLQARKLTAPVSIGNYVVVGDLEGFLHWMRREDGQFVARYHVGNASIKVPPLVVENTLVAYNSDGKIVALRPE